LPQQFDIVANRNAATREDYPYLIIILQHDRLSFLRSTVAAPVVTWTNALSSSRIHPTVTVAGRRYVVLVEELAAVPTAVFGDVTGSAEANRYQIIAALDLLFTGI
jgi:toxin CcdB